MYGKTDYVKRLCRVLVPRRAEDGGKNVCTNGTQKHYCFRVLAAGLAGCMSDYVAYCCESAVHRCVVSGGRFSCCCTSARASERERLKPFNNVGGVLLMCCAEWWCFGASGGERIGHRTGHCVCTAGDLREAADDGNPFPNVLCV